MIDLGLGRITALLGHLGNPHYAFRSVHVAGTNGKGSVCAYISSVLNTAKIRTGRFTSPHLVYRWDCIEVNGKTIKQDVFLEVEKYIKEVDRKNQLGATEFELLTATAFELFSREKVKLAVIEVGLGGKLDSTNVLEASNVVCSVITKIGHDHQGFLGNTLSDIAAQKAGIIKKGAPSIVDGSNEKSVLDTIATIAKELNSDLIISEPESTISSSLLGGYQKDNLGCALNALKIIQKGEPAITNDIITLGIKKTSWPGRLQYLQLFGKTVLIDGAHNEQSAELLGEFVKTKLRSDKPITWIIGFSKPKDQFIKIIPKFGIRPGDFVLSTGFTTVEGMPWVKPASPVDILEAVEEFASDSGNGTSDNGNGISAKDSVLSRGGHTAVDRAQLKEVLGKSSGPVVICGSLYLVSEIMSMTVDQEREG